MSPLFLQLYPSLQKRKNNNTLLNVKLVKLVFGAPIDIFQIQRKMAGTYTEGGTMIPPILFSAFQFINRHALDTTGIFRLSGSRLDLNHYVQQFNAGVFHDPILSTGIDPDAHDFYTR
jgi:hypothetical protein